MTIYSKNPPIKDFSIQYTTEVRVGTVSFGTMNVLKQYSQETTPSI